VIEFELVIFYVKIDKLDWSIK